MIYGSELEFPDTKAVWLLRNGVGDVIVMRRPFPGAVGFREVADTPKNRTKGALPPREALEAHERKLQQ